MYLEERIGRLEEENAELKEKVALMEARGTERFVTPKQLAEMMQCAPNTIYVRIRNGEIYASRKTGAPRIPLSQFYNPESEQAPLDISKVRKQKRGHDPTMEELVFGKV